MCWLLAFNMEMALSHAGVVISGDVVGADEHGRSA